MKKLLFLLLLIPILTYSQERQQKQAVRQGSVTPAPAPRIQSTPRSGPDYSEYQQKQGVRQQSEYKPGRNYPISTPGYYHPYNNWAWGNNWRYRRFGHPTFWEYDYWVPHYWYDPWGYRQPARIYYYDEKRKTDTIRGTKPVISVGVQGNRNELGGFFTVGKKTYMILEYQRTFKRNESTYYPDLTTDVVLPWNDKRLPDIVRSGAFYIGGGRRINRTGVHVLLGVVSEKVRSQYFDELFILANNGKYSIPKYKDSYITLKGGVMHDFKFASIKADYEPARNRITLGVGVNF